MRIPRPTSITLVGAGVSAPIDPVGVDDDGLVEIPEDVDRVGWYRFGAAAGAAQGSTVLVGHRDYRGQGAGVLVVLDAARPGDRITVGRRDGSVLNYRVVSRESFAKGEVPLEELFSREGTPRLTLITCGGPFDPQARSYRDNIVVTAVPVEER